MTLATHQQAAILDIIERHLPNARTDRFAPEARLNADLALDSIMLLQLLVHLELEHGLHLPEETLMTAELDTVADLDALLQKGPTGATL